MLSVCVNCVVSLVVKSPCSFPRPIEFVKGLVGVARSQVEGMTGGSGTLGVNKFVL